MNDGSVTLKAGSFATILLAICLTFSHASTDALADIDNSSSHVRPHHTPQDVNCKPGSTVVTNHDLLCNRGSIMPLFRCRIVRLQKERIFNFTGPELL